MGAKTLLFVLGFGGVVALTFFAPLVGVLGYVSHYCLGPERQWWEQPIQHWGVRYSFVLALVTAVSVVLHRGDLQYGKRLLMRHEWLILGFLAVVWLSVLIGEPTAGRYTTVDHPSVKLTKVIIFVMMMTHVVTTRRRLDWLLWTLVIGALVLGWEAYWTPRSHYARGRLEGVGGPDFSEANFFAAFMAAMLPIIGVQFLRSPWPGKLLCAVTGAFTFNAIVLTRSRGAVIGLLAGVMMGLLLAPKGMRPRILLLAVLAGIGAYRLMDPQFIHRSSTIVAEGEERDRSAESRIEIWRAGLRMLADHPEGVGAGNFYQSIGRYSPAHAGRDAHNTLVRCSAELGMLGVLLFLGILVSAGYMTYRTTTAARALDSPAGQDLRLVAYGMAVSLTVLMTCGLTVTLLYTEATWWLLALPVCLARSLENFRAEAAELLPLQRRETRPVAALSPVAARAV
jgi:O-antigen ligase